ncbi:MAG TPA: hypothetical protein VGF65_11235 [Mycobacterium sp.]|jgi:hypothetical protein
MSQSIDPNLQVTITLAAGEWNVVLAALDEAPMPKRISAPLAGKIIGVVTQTAQHIGPEEAELMRPPGRRPLPEGLRGNNGADGDGRAAR